MTSNGLTPYRHSDYSVYYVRDAALLVLIPDPLPLVSYHWRKLASDSFNRTDEPPSRAGVLIKYAEWLTESEQNNGTWVTYPVAGHRPRL